MHANSELIFKKYALGHFESYTKVLEIGPSGNPSHYSCLVSNKTIKWHTIDIDTTYLQGGEKNTLHIVSNLEYNYPIEDATFDIVLCGQVMEHVSKIWLWIKELERITKPGGKIILISPISWPYHEAPIDCWRIYPEGMKALINDFTNLNILVCTQETLEHLFLKTDNIIPGKSSIGLDMQPHLHVRRKLFFNRICKFLIKFHRHFNNYIIPIEAAYDNICILQKPLQD
jgi:ubiquinone/menaquinone biosynthesis C-methylase UbiE